MKYKYIGNEKLRIAIDNKSMVLIPGQEIQTKQKIKSKLFEEIKKKNNKGE